MFKVEHPCFIDASLALATFVRANHQMIALFDDAFAKLIETRLTREQIFERYRSTLKNRDALAGTIEGLV